MKEIAAHLVILKNLNMAEKLSLEFNSHLFTELYLIDFFISGIHTYIKLQYIKI